MGISQLIGSLRTSAMCVCVEDAVSVAIFISVLNQKMENNGIVAQQNRVKAFIVFSTSPRDIYILSVNYLDCVVGDFFFLFFSLSLVWFRIIVLLFMLA